jgi:hypothetical protein
MPYVQAFGDCIACGQRFSFNPERVPSIRARRDGRTVVPDPAAPLEPICRNCFERQNKKRCELGLREIRLTPGAYEPEEVA